MKSLISKSLYVVGLFFLCLVAYFLGHRYDSYCKLKNEDVSNREYELYIDEHIDLKRLIVNNGDTTAYRKYLEAPSVRDKNNEIDKLSYSLFMSNKYDYPYASYQVYKIISDWDKDGLDSLDIDSQKLAIYYLHKAVQSDKSYSQEYDSINNIFKYYQ